MKKIHLYNFLNNFYDYLYFLYFISNVKYSASIIHKLFIYNKSSILKDFSNYTNLSLMTLSYNLTYFNLTTISNSSRKKWTIYKVSINAHTIAQSKVSLLDPHTE